MSVLYSISKSLQTGYFEIKNMLIISSSKLEMINRLHTFKSVHNLAVTEGQNLHEVNRNSGSGKTEFKIGVLLVAMLAARP